MLDITPRDVHMAACLLENSIANCVTKPTRYYREVISGLRINDLRAPLSIATGVKLVWEHTTVPLSADLCPDYPIALAFHLGLRWYVQQHEGSSIGHKH